MNRADKTRATRDRKHELIPIVLEAHRRGETRTKIAKDNGIGAATVFRWIRDADKEMVKVEKKAAKKASNSAPMQTLLVPDQKTKIMLFVGDVDELLNIARKLQ